MACFGLGVNFRRIPCKVCFAPDPRSLEADYLDDNRVFLLLGRDSSLPIGDRCPLPYLIAAFDQFGEPKG